MLDVIKYTLQVYSPDGAHVFELTSDQANAIANGAPLAPACPQISEIRDYRLTYEHRWYQRDQLRVVQRTLVGFHRGMTPKRFKAVMEVSQNG